MTIVGSMYSKSCHLDPIPDCVIEDCFANVSSVITRTTNHLMESGILLTDLKVASVRPPLKKQSLSSVEFKNFRPILNLPFLSKVVEKCVIKQLIDHLDANDLNVIYQSANRHGNGFNSCPKRYRNCFGSEKISDSAAS